MITKSVFKIVRDKGSRRSSDLHILRDPPRAPEVVGAVRREGDLGEAQPRIEGKLDTWATLILI